MQDMEMAARWRENYPDEELPEYLREEFCLPESFKAIVDEVVALKKQVGELTDYVYEK